MRHGSLGCKVKEEPLQDMCALTFGCLEARAVEILQSYKDGGYLMDLHVGLMEKTPPTWLHWSYLSKAGQDTSSLSSEPSLLPAHAHAHTHLKNKHTNCCTGVAAFIGRSYQEKYHWTKLSSRLVLWWDCGSPSHCRPADGGNQHWGTWHF